MLKRNFFNAVSQWTNKINCFIVKNTKELLCATYKFQDLNSADEKIKNNSMVLSKTKNFEK